MAQMGHKILAIEINFKGQSDSQPEIRSPERNREADNLKSIKDERIGVSSLTVKDPVSVRKPL
jgi:hypothetical protein